MPSLVPKRITRRQASPAGHGVRRRAWRVAACCVSLLCALPVTAAQYLEGDQGDLPADFRDFWRDSFPSHLTLEPGSNLVAGGFDVLFDIFPDGDSIKFTVPEGLTLAGIDMSFFARGFIRELVDYPVRRYRFELRGYGDTPPPPFSYLTIEALKTGLFEPRDNPIAAPVFLPAGTYGLAWGRGYTELVGSAVTDVLVGYRFDFKIAAAPVPLPPALALLALPLVGLRARRLPANATNPSSAR